MATIRIRPGSEDRQRRRMSKVALGTSLALAGLSLPLAVGIAGGAAAKPDDGKDAQVNFVKVDDKGELLGGATFKLISEKDSSELTVTDNDTNDANKTDGEFTVLIGKPGDKYVLVEMTAPTGYIKSSDAPTLSVAAGPDGVYEFTNSPSPTETSTATATATATETATSTATATATGTPTVTVTATPVPTATVTAAETSPAPTFPPTTPEETATATETATEEVVVIEEETEAPVVLPEVEVVEEAGAVTLAATGGEGTQAMGLALLLLSLGAALFFGTQLRRQSI